MEVKLKEGGEEMACGSNVFIGRRLKFLTTQVTREVNHGYHGSLSSQVLDIYIFKKSEFHDFCVIKGNLWAQLKYVQFNSYIFNMRGLKYINETNVTGGRVEI